MQLSGSCDIFFVPKHHLLTTGWSVFVSAKRLLARDSVLFIWNEKNQLLLGIRHANRPQTVMPLSVLSYDSMHIGLLAAVAHAAATNSCFTVFYNQRASPSEFVIPLSKYIKAVYHTHVSVGMRFRMLFETEESGVHRASPSEFVIPLSKYIKAVYHTHVSVGMRFRMLFETEESGVHRYLPQRVLDDIQTKAPDYLYSIGHLIPTIADQYERTCLMVIICKSLVADTAVMGNIKEVNSKVGYQW